MPWRNVKPETVKAIAEDYRNGVDTRTIRTKYSTSYNTILEAARMHGIPARGSGWTPPSLAERDEQMYADFMAGMEMKQIAAKYGTCYNSARKGVVRAKQRRGLNGFDLSSRRRV